MLKIIAIDLSIRSINKKKEIRIQEKKVISILVLSHCQPSSTVLTGRPFQPSGGAVVVGAGRKIGN